MTADDGSTPSPVSPSTPAPSLTPTPTNIDAPPEGELQPVGLIPLAYGDGTVLEAFYAKVRRGVVVPKKPCPTPVGRRLLRSIQQLRVEVWSVLCVHSGKCVASCLCVCDVLLSACAQCIFSAGSLTATSVSSCLWWDDTVVGGKTR